MKLLCFCLAVCLLVVAAPPGARAAGAAAPACATSPAKLAEPPKVELPEGAKPTAKLIAFEADIGSDGRVRGLQMDQSSGDANVDLAFKQALQSASYLPPQNGCVAYSGGIAVSYALGPDGGAPSARTLPAKQLTTCTPFISAFISPTARDRKRTGTAVVTVELDAAATRAGVPAIRKSTGSPVLDQEAIRIASTAHYRFLDFSACTPQAFTYLFELTFQ